MLALKSSIIGDFDHKNAGIEDFELISNRLKSITVVTPFLQEWGNDRHHDWMTNPGLPN